MFQSNGIYINFWFSKRWKRNVTIGPFEISQPPAARVNWKPGYLISPPHYTLYTYFNLRNYFLMFVFHFILQTFLVHWVKSKLSHRFVKEFNWLEKIIHCLENLNIPYNAKEWDDAKDNARRHRWRMKLNLKEVQAVILIKIVFNLILLLPMVLLGKLISNPTKAFEGREV